MVYDGIGLGGAPRVWWTFRAFGAKNVFILDGGLPKWKAEGRPLQPGAVSRAPRKFKAELNTAVVAGVSDIQRALSQNAAQVVDARPANRFRGKRRSRGRACDRATCRARSMCRRPTLVENGRLIAPERIAQTFAAGGVDLTSRSSPVAGRA